MNYLAYHENKMRGTFDFPIELSLVNHYTQGIKCRFIGIWNMK
ncbi:MAG: hypothetical protein RSC96_02815 [Oscillospiraceae bacterium]